MQQAKLFEKYRPTSWGEVLGQDKIVKRVNVMRDRGAIAGNAFWISGKSGTGKTTIARLIAGEIADDFCTEEIDADSLTPNSLREIEKGMHYIGMGRGGRALIVNEAHGLRKNVIRQLLVTLESLPAHCVVIFTTTKAGQDALFEDYDDAGPLLSRCVQLNLNTQGLAPLLAERGRDIAQMEGLDGKAVSVYLRYLNQKHGNMRDLLQFIGSGGMLD